jgi:hypothetical protein
MTDKTVQDNCVNIPKMLILEIISQAGLFIVLIGLPVIIRLERVEQFQLSRGIQVYSGELIRGGGK